MLVLEFLKVKTASPTIETQQHKLPPIGDLFNYANPLQDKI
ncbi:hypothetical protein HpMMM65_04600 [Helicobacter pylori]